MKPCFASATTTSLFFVHWCRCCAINLCFTKIEKANYDKGERIEYISMHWCMININKVDVLIWRCRQNWFIVSDWSLQWLKSEELDIIFWISALCEYSRIIEINLQESIFSPIFYPSSIWWHINMFVIMDELSFVIYDN